MIIEYLIIAYLCGFFYRLGGSEKTGKWYDFMINTKTRDLGVPLCITIEMLLLGQIHPALILCFILLFAAHTTYWKKNGTDAKWYNWALTGFFYGLAMFPLVFAQQIWPLYFCPEVHTHWVGFSIRTVMMATITALWSELNSKAVAEEFGRGVIEAVTLPLLLIG